MKKLLSFIASDNYLDQIGDGWNGLDKILQEYQLDGIETMTGGFYKPENIEVVKPIGHHLLYFPSWLHMWLEDEVELIKEFESLDKAVEVYGGWGRQRLIDFYREEFLDSIQMGSEYMVFHVAHVGLDEVFGDNFKYGNKEVLTYTADLLNEVFKGVDNGPILLLENLWWPGMDLLDEIETKDFLDQIKYSNKGIMLDISHLTLTHENIDNFENIEKYIGKVILNSPTLKKHIRGIHLNTTFPVLYKKNKLRENKNKIAVTKNRMERYRIIMDHITSLDSHKIYDDISINKILEKLDIEYLVYEFKWKDKKELLENLEKQNKVLLI
jgi:hypothetical protein